MLRADSSIAASRTDRPRAGELIEETGYDSADGVVELGGDSANPISALFNASAPGEGVRFFGVGIDPVEIVSIEGRLTLRVDRGPQDPDDTRLQQHDATPRSRSRPGSTAREPAARNTTTGATVAHQREPPSPRYRDRAGKRRTTTGAATSSIYRVSTSPSSDLSRHIRGIGVRGPQNRSSVPLSRRYASPERDSNP